MHYPWWHVPFLTAPMLIATSRQVVQNAELRRLFWILNRFWMVPLFRLGLGVFLGNPLTGYIMVLRTVGRKTGKIRFTPVNYAILDGSVYCLAGFGAVAHWYRNVQTDPRVGVILPGGAVAGVAEDVTDDAERLRALRHVLKNAGFAGFLAGVNPWRASDTVLLEKTRGQPVIRIRAVGVDSGAADPGGWLWVLVLAAIVWLIVR